MLSALVRNAIVLFGALGVLVCTAIAVPGGEQGQAPLLEDRRRSDGAQERFVDFQTCSPAMGLVHSVVVRGDLHPSGTSNSHGSPIVFRSGSDYDITITFTSPVKAHRPRAALMASDGPLSSFSDAGLSAESSVSAYAYSGQSFDACKYTSCPLRANTLSTYTYSFHTLHSDFSWLTFNITSAIVQSPSLFCVGFPVTFLDEESGTFSSEEEANAAWEPQTGDSISEDGSGGLIGGGTGIGGSGLVLQADY